MNSTQAKETLLAHPRNGKITFDREAHKYWYGDTEFYGVTSWIKKYQPAFDKEGKSKGTAFKMGISQQEVLDMWKEKSDDAIKYGNAVHDAIENYYTDGIIDTDYETELDNVKTELELWGLLPVACEFVVYDESIKRSSPIDLLCWRDTTKEFVIVDTKTPAKGIGFEGYNGEKLLYPFRDLQNSSYNTYSMQTQVYAKWLSELWGLPVAEDRYLLYVRENKCELIPCVDMSDEIEKLYEMEIA
jgi:hypothetical protein